MECIWGGERSQSNLQFPLMRITKDFPFDEYIGIENETFQSIYLCFGPYFHCFTKGSRNILFVEIISIKTKV